MNRRNRTFIVVGVAAVLALVASLGVYRAILRASDARSTGGSHPVVVAAGPLALGTMLAATDLRVVDWPDAARVAGTVTSIDTVVGRGVIASLVANEPVVADKLAPVGSGAGLPLAIPSGMRAMAIKVNDVVGVAGFAVPGTRVDVVATLRLDRDAEEVSRVVLNNVQVLTAGTNQEQTKTNDPIRANVVTLLVTLEDAERLALIMNEGTLSLALRNPLDVGVANTVGVRMKNLVGTAVPVSPAVRPAAVRSRVTPPTPLPPPAAAPPPPHLVEVIRAAKRTDEIIKK